MQVCKADSLILRLLKSSLLNFYDHKLWIWKAVPFGLFHNDLRLGWSKWLTTAFQLTDFLVGIQTRKLTKVPIAAQPLSVTQSSETSSNVAYIKTSATARDIWLWYITHQQNIIFLYPSLNCCSINYIIWNCLDVYNLSGEVTRSVLRFPNYSSLIAQSSARMAAISESL
jgi:hypothetical protein